MRKSIAAVVVLLLVLVGCTSGDGTSSGGTTAVEEPAGEPGPGVTADTIKIGVTYVDLEAIKDVVDITHGDYEGAYNALIADLNERGGINGRQIEVVFAPVNPIGTEAAEAACLRLTEDEQVFLTIGFFLGDAVLCHLETHGQAVIGGSMSPDRLARARAPWFTYEPGSDSQADAVRALAEAGELKGKVAVFTRADDESLLRDTIEPLLDELGVDPVDVALVDAPPDDIAAANAQVGVIAERFMSAGAEKVLIVGQAGTIWATGIEGRTYKPQLLLTSYNEMLAYTLDESNDELSFLDGAVSAGSIAHQMVFQTESFDQKCLSVMRDAGVEFKDPAEDPEDNGVTAIRTACNNLTLLEAILTKAGEVPNYDTLRAAGEGLGNLDMPGYDEPWHFGPPPSADGDEPLLVFDWDPDEEEFVARED